MNEKKQYIGSCVDNPFEDLDILDEVINGGVEISLKEFITNCDLCENYELLESMVIFGKPSYSFYKYEGSEVGEVYFYVNSSIESFYQ